MWPAVLPSVIQWNILEYIGPRPIAGAIVIPLTLCPRTPTPIPLAPKLMAVPLAS